MIGHIGIELSNELILFPFRKAGILIVGIFFFLSGYGLMYSLKNKTDYLCGFLKKRLGALLLPTGLVCLCLLIVLMAQNSSVIGGNPINLIWEIFSSINWYVWEVLGCYLVFYLVFRFVRIEWGIPALLAVCFIFIIICYLGGVSNPWYGSTMCFPLGLLAGEYEKPFMRWCNIGRYKNVVLLLILGCSITMFFILPERSFLGAVVSRNISSVCFVLLVLILLQKIRVGNSASRFLGKISFEVFLIHPLVIQIYHSDLVYLKNNIIYVIAVIITSILLGLLLNALVKAIKEMVKQARA